MNNKKKITIIGASIICVLVLIIGAVLIFKGDKGVNKENLSNILSKGTSLESFERHENNVIFNIKGNLGEDDILNLCEDLIKLDSDVVSKFYIFDEETEKPLVTNGFYATGLSNTVVLDGKNKVATISSYSENEVEAKELKVTDFEYGDVRNDDGLAFVTVESETLKEDITQDQLLVIADMIKNINKENDIREVVVSTTINNIKYGVSTTNRDIIETTKSHKI